MYRKRVIHLGEQLTLPFRGPVAPGCLSLANADNDPFGESELIAANADGELAIFKGLSELYPTLSPTVTAAEIVASLEDPYTSDLLPYATASGLGPVTSLVASKCFPGSDDVGVLVLTAEGQLHLFHIVPHEKSAVLPLTLAPTATYSIPFDAHRVCVLPREKLICVATRAQDISFYSLCLHNPPFDTAVTAGQRVERWILRHAASRRLLLPTSVFSFAAATLPLFTGPPSSLQARSHEPASAPVAGLGLELNEHARVRTTGPGLLRSCLLLGLDVGGVVLDVQGVLGLLNTRPSASLDTSDLADADLSPVPLSSAIEAAVVAPLPNDLSPDSESATALELSVTAPLDDCNIPLEGLSVSSDPATLIVVASSAGHLNTMHMCLLSLSLPTAASALIVLTAPTALFPAAPLPLNGRLASVLFAPLLAPPQTQSASAAAPKLVVPAGPLLPGGHYASVQTVCIRLDGLTYVFPLCPPQEPAVVMRAAWTAAACAAADACAAAADAGDVGAELLPTAASIREKVLVAAAAAAALAVATACNNQDAPISGGLRSFATAPWSTPHTTATSLPGLPTASSRTEAPASVAQPLVPAPPSLPVALRYPFPHRVSSAAAGLFALAPGVSVPCLVYAGFQHTLTVAPFPSPAPLPSAVLTSSASAAAPSAAPSPTERLSSTACVWAETLGPGPTLRSFAAGAAAATAANDLYALARSDAFPPWTVPFEENPGYLVATGAVSAEGATVSFLGGGADTDARVVEGHAAASGEHQSTITATCDCSTASTATKPALPSSSAYADTLSSSGTVPSSIGSGIYRHSELVSSSEAADGTAKRAPSVPDQAVPPAALDPSATSDAAVASPASKTQQALAEANSTTAVPNDSVPAPEPVSIPLPVPESAQESGHELSVINTGNGLVPRVPARAPLVSAASERELLRLISEQGAKIRQFKSNKVSVHAPHLLDAEVRQLLALKDQSVTFASATAAGVDVDLDRLQVTAPAVAAAAAVGAGPAESGEPAEGHAAGAGTGQTGKSRGSFSTAPTTAAPTPTAIGGGAGAATAAGAGAGPAGGLATGVQRGGAGKGKKAKGSRAAAAAAAAAAVSTNPSAFAAATAAAETAVADAIAASDAEGSTVDEYVWIWPPVQDPSDDLLSWLVQCDPPLKSIVTVEAGTDTHTSPGDADPVFTASSSSASIAFTTDASAASEPIATKQASGQSITRTGRQLVEGALALTGSTATLENVPITLHRDRAAALDAISALSAADTQGLRWYRDALQAQIAAMKDY